MLTNVGVHLIIICFQVMMSTQFIIGEKKESPSQIHSLLPSNFNFSLQSTFEDTTKGNFFTMNARATSPTFQHYKNVGRETHDPQAVISTSDSSKPVDRSFVPSKHYLPFFDEELKRTQRTGDENQTEWINNKNLIDYNYINWKQLLNDSLSYTCYNISVVPYVVCIPEGKSYVFESDDKLFEYINRTFISSTGKNPILKICQLTGVHLHGQLPQLDGWVTDFKYYDVAHEEDFVQLCLPLFQKLSVCKSGRYLNTCFDGQYVMIFIHDQRCRNHVHKINSLIVEEKEFECFQQLCEGSYETVNFVVSGMPVSLYPTDNECKNFSLSLIFHRHLDLNESLYMTYNIYWPCCYANYYVVWEQSPDTAGLVRDWSYLPDGCRAGEIFFVTCGGFVAVIGTVGNFIVLIVMFSGGHRNEPSCFLRTSLSLSDFLMSSVVVITAFKTNIALINGHFDAASFYHMDLIKNYTNGTFDIINHYATLNYSDGWFYVTQAHVLCLCASVAIMTMFFLSVERLILASCPLKYKKLFTLDRVKRAIASSWVLGLVFFLVLIFYGCPVVSWFGWTKLTLVISNVKKEFKSFKIISSVLFSTGICTVLLSMLSLFAFYKEQARVAAEWKSLNMRVTGNFKSESIYIAITLVIIAVLCLITVIPIGVAHIYDLKHNVDSVFPIVQYLSRWLFFAGSAVNPFIYNMRSHLFRSDLAEFLQKIVPESLKVKLKPYVTHSRYKFMNYVKDLDKGAKEKGEPHNGLPEGSKLSVLGLGFVDTQRKM